MQSIRKILGEPLLHFLLIGVGLFYLFGLMNGPATNNPNQIVVTPGQVELLVQNYSRTWMRPPTPEEMDFLVNEYVRDEVYYREALALGLDKDDDLIRRRLRQKLEFILDDVAAQLDPSDEELNEFLNANVEQFRTETEVAFQQVYLSFDKRDDIVADAAAMLRRLEAGEDPEQLGDSVMLRSSFELTSQQDIERQFGFEFAHELLNLPVGEWVGPVASGFGGHLVLVSERVEGYVPELDEIRDVVVREWRHAKQKTLQDETFRELVQNYEVVVEEPAESVTGSGFDAAAAGVAQ